MDHGQPRRRVRVIREPGHRPTFDCPTCAELLECDVPALLRWIRLFNGGEANQLLSGALTRLVYDWCYPPYQAGRSLPDGEPTIAQLRAAYTTRRALLAIDGVSTTRADEIAQLFTRLGCPLEPDAPTTEADEPLYHRYQYLLVKEALREFRSLCGVANPLLARGLGALEHRWRSERFHHGYHAPQNATIAQLRERFPTMATVEGADNIGLTIAAEIYAFYLRLGEPLPLTE